MRHTLGHLNDSVLSSRLAAAIRKNIGEQPISQVPFYQPDVWRYHHLPMRNGPPDLSKGGLPADVRAALELPAGLTAGAVLMAACCTSPKIVEAHLASRAGRSAS